MHRRLFQFNPQDYPSPYQAQEQARRRRLLISVSTGVALALLPVALAFGVLALTSRAWQSITLMIIAALIMLLATFTREQGQRGRVEQSSYILLIALLILFGLNGLLIEGLAPLVAPTYAVIVMMAGMMLGVRGGVVVAVLASVFGLVTQSGIAAAVVQPPLQLNANLLIVSMIIVVADFLFIGYLS